MPHVPDSAALSYTAGQSALAKTIVARCLPPKTFRVPAYLKCSGVLQLTILVSTP
jgi:hypothetical protein